MSDDQKLSGLPEHAPAYEYIGMQSLNDTYTRVINDLDTVWPLFYEKNDRARRNASFVKGDQWDEVEKLAFERQFRIPYVFDQIQPKVNSLLGAHDQMKLEPRIVPFEPGDEQASALLNRIVRWADQMNDMETVQREVFYDMVVKGVGVSCVRWALEDAVGGYPKVERVPPFQMAWDSNSKQSDISDARWLARVMVMTREEAISEFPEHAEIVRKVGAVQRSQSWSYIDMLTSRQQRTGFLNAYSQEGKNLIRIVEHYEKIQATVYIVCDGYLDAYQEFESADDADMYAKGLVTGYMNEGVETVRADGSDLIEIVEMQKDFVIQNLVIGDKCVSRLVTELPDFPYVVSFCYSDDGEYWSFVDSLISPQILLNRLASEWDNQIGRSNKQLITVIQQKLAQGWTIADVARERSKTGGVIPVYAHDAIHERPNTPASPDIPNTINFVMSHMTDVVGGRNVMGLQENAAESGAAVRERKEAAGVARLPVFVNINRWRRHVTELCMWYMKNYLVDGQLLRIMGESDVQWVEIDTDVLDTIREARADVSVTESLQSENSKERMFVQLKELFMTLQGAVPADVMLATMLEYSALPESNKKQIMERIESQKQYAAQQAEQGRQQKLQQQAKDQIERKQIRESME